MVTVMNLAVSIGNERKSLTFKPISSAGYVPHIPTLLRNTIIGGKCHSMSTFLPTVTFL